MKKLHWLLVAAGLQALPLSGVELIQNGGFETGTFQGWSVANQEGGQGDFLVIPVGGLPPLSNLEIYRTAPNSLGGAFFAVSDTVQGGPGAHVLSQAFTVPSGAGSVQVSFQLFENNWAGLKTVNPEGLDISSGTNQHIRIDIMSSTASAFDTGTGVLRNLLLGGGDTAAVQPYSNYTFDISDVAGTPGTYVLRFAEVDNQYFLNMGIDNVSVAAVPEPSTLALLGLGSVLVFFLRRKSVVAPKGT